MTKKQVPVTPVDDSNVLAKFARSLDIYHQGVPNISLTLDNGTEVEMVAADELHIPDDGADLIQAAMNAPAQIAFWSYQAERQMRYVRSLDHKRATEEGCSYLRYRAHYEKNEPELPTEATLRSHVDNDTAVRKARILADVARRDYGSIVALRNAVEHRSYFLRKLLDIANNPTRS